jgi:hypothetical protein
MAALRVEELTYPEGLPVPDDGSSEESDESSEDAAPLVPTGETIPLLIRLPGDSTFNKATPVTIKFSTEQDKQEAQMFDELEALFGIYGSRIFSAFEAGLKNSDPQPIRKVGVEGHGGVTEGGSAPFSQLQASFGRARDRLAEQIRKELRELQEVAQKSALKRLTESKPEIEREAKKYLSGATDDAKVAAILTSDATHTELSGSDALSMMQAMLEIQALMGQLEEARDRLPRAMAKGREDYVPIMKGIVWALGPTDEIVRAAAPAEVRQLEELQNSLANLLAVHCADYPILYRLVGQVSIPTDLTYELRPDGVRIAKSKHSSHPPPFQGQGLPCAQRGVAGCCGTFGHDQK